MSTLQTPLQPIILAAALDRSKVLPFTKGPRSLITTITDFPLYVTFTLVPNGNVLCAAVNALGLNFTPLAVILCLLHSPGCIQSYHDAFTIAASLGVGVVSANAMIKLSRSFLIGPSFLES